MTYTQSFVRFTSSPTVALDDLYATDPTEGVRCEPRGAEYWCVLPIAHSPMIFDTTTLGRAVYESSSARDWGLELTYLDSDLSGNCIVEPAIDGILRGSLEPRLTAFSDVIQRFVSEGVGASLVDDFEPPPPLPDRIEPDDLPACGDPTTGVDPLACQRYPSFGGHRHQCDTSVTNSAGEYVCNRARVEIRRMQVRPEGLEFVFAEGTDDPQHDLLQYQPGVIQNEPGVTDLSDFLFGIQQTAADTLFEMFDREDPDLCEVARWRNDGIVPSARGVLGWHALSALIPAETICPRDQSACTGICRQFGTTCEAARAFGIDRLLGSPLPATGDLVCELGQCAIASP